jgi:hypothetical protein
MSLDLKTARKLVSSITRAGNDGSWRKAAVRQDSALILQLNSTTITRSHRRDEASAEGQDLWSYGCLNCEERKQKPIDSERLV